MDKRWLALLEDVLTSWCHSLLSKSSIKDAAVFTLPQILTSGSDVTPPSVHQRQSSWALLNYYAL